MKGTSLDKRCFLYCKCKWKLKIFSEKNKDSYLGIVYMLADELIVFLKLIGDLPSIIYKDELKNNNRAHSSKLRILERILD